MNVRKCGVFSKEILKIPFLDVLLSCDVVPARSCIATELSYVAGWGLKPSANIAREFSKKNNITYLSLEDPFIRSLGCGVNGSISHGLIVDDVGIYYDSNRPSKLENLILFENFEVNELERSKKVIDYLIKNRLSKYNHALEGDFSRFKDKKCVLVVDQTFGDASITYGGADSSSFDKMLDAAIEENIDSDILIKVHPDVLAGKKNGYLYRKAIQRGCHLIAEDCNPWSLFDLCHTVYTVTSQLGFEALLAGLKVVCFGIPFYSGWLLTDDRISNGRRGKKRSLEHVFYCAYIKYCKYINPYTGNLCQIEDTLKIINLQKKHMERYKGTWHAVGFSKWKRNILKKYLGRAAEIKFSSKNNISICDEDNIIVWGSSYDYLGDKSIMEDGFLRSVGLGSNLVVPVSLVIDTRGIYYDPSRESDLECILNKHEFSSDLLLRSDRLIKKIINLRLSKYNVDSFSIDFKIPLTKKVILIPGQVEDDASIIKGSPVVKKNIDLLHLVRKNNPDAFVIYKPHPDVTNASRDGVLKEIPSGLVDLIVTDISVVRLFDLVHEVHTMTSLTGFEALLRGISVYTYGLPFYAGWGLTTDMLECERREKSLTVSQLAAGALILYPIYLDPHTGDICDVETATDLLYSNISLRKDLSFTRKLFNFVIRRS
ncbi:capsular polysaccharide biosynthesis protein [Neptunomonas phycophila]|uniref:capsular polysaccharide biosynthesis protein n=1 Tax=Neptunomonas phycophila TaxID=1572645 RepID=UPI0026E2F0EC|nr:capsular polysaccharide biosynthesis protein [Neptunomonas phycophila]MDO6467094.1 capsular polysaccharide biosynthesis protein [Neptunomonas phycophila]